MNQKIDRFDVTHPIHLRFLIFLFSAQSTKSNNKNKYFFEIYKVGQISGSINKKETERVEI